ncbi:hypothetical protein PVAND_014148 [Polypedilum vanderplanki]|uniref:Zinc finger protein n=1 Tax=Polypedilum vanderplanki TaxID=319348 RepID=A0A9J6CSQ5_POLVA|nr:hypothetical protein PVAND_014148 [Polypedilum vanderplanki]
MQLNQICRLCLEEKTNNDTVLVEIFSAFINEPGKEKLNDKIRSLTGLSIVKNDALPKTICHKCVVSIDSFYDFKNRVLTSDEKLRQFLNLNGTVTSDENHEENENSIEDANVIKLDPNKVYESSDEEDQIETQLEMNKHKEQQQPEKLSLVIQQQDKKENINTKKPCNASTRDKMEIFHCKFCDVVFSEIDLCTNHENFNHDRNNPFECSLCPFKANQHQHLIIHIKNDHHTEKPFICVVCSKNFLRRSDLRKHIFVHAGIRLFSCNLCNKSFTRAQNLSKHKRIHLESNQKNHKCTLCPKAFISNNELARHMEIHMNRNALNCKYCNLVFTQRDELEIHQRSHIAQMKAVQVKQLQSAPPTLFYNQNQPSENQQSPMNFYKEHVDLSQQQQPRIEHPIINQLLTNLNNSFCKCDKCPEQFPSIKLLQTHQSIYHSKNFVCMICNNAYYKKKELDRHVISVHTDIKFNCSKCTKSFSRKDKLTRHERTHLNPAFFNCPLCPAVFVRKHLLELHSKIHTMPNNNYGSIDGSGAMMIMNFEEPILPPLQPLPPLTQIQETPSLITENLIPNYVSPIKQPSPLDLSPLKVIEQQQQPPSTSSSAIPMNLTMNQSLTPMDLSHEKTLNEKNELIKNEPQKIIIESDDDDDLKIIENEEKTNDFIPKTENEEMPSQKSENIAELNLVKKEELIFPLTSRLADLDKMEPSKDLPMEILDI